MKQLLENMLDAYENGKVSRRRFIQRLVALGLGGGAASQLLAASAPKPLFRTRTINHVTIRASDVARSKAFYQGLTGLPIRDEANDFCEFRLDGGFLGLYAAESAGRSGFDHFCFGIENYEAQRVHKLLTDVAPESHPEIENKDQVYVHDPDGVLVQFADVAYKR
jgi:catechol 2,3-dioxygenase-like lactoylglutathione lyase family enzyme